MSEEPKTTPDGVADMMRIWFDMASHAAETYQAMAGAAVSPEVFRDNRSQLFKAWGKYWEQFMRSSPFLEIEKQCLGGGLESRKRLREYLGWLHHELQLATSQDIDQVIRTVRRLGEDIEEQFEQVDRRLKNLAARVDNLADRVEVADRRARPEGDSAAGDRNRAAQDH